MFHPSVIRSSDIRAFLFLEVGKILFIENLVGEKRRERLHIGECRGTRKPVIPGHFFLRGFYGMCFLVSGKAERLLPYFTEDVLR
jgi:hypothetical protein